MTPILMDLVWWIKKHWVAFVVLLATGAWGVILAWPRDSGVVIVFCDAGQGDETLIMQGFYQILIDGNRPGRGLACLDKFMPFFDRTIEMLMLSHPQLDHFGGLTDVVNRYHLMSFVYNGRAGETKEWGEFSQALRTKRIKIIVAGRGDSFSVGPIHLSILWPDRDKDLAESKGGPSDSRVFGVRSTRDLNETSLVARMEIGQFDALFTGDLDGVHEAEVAKLGGLGGIEVLKVSHHGSKTSSVPEFLDVVRPKLAVIEVGKNSYGHPTKEAISRLEDAGAQVMRTDEGDVVVRTDGKKGGAQQVSPKFKNAL